jgi:hypothetical protein
LCPSEIIKPRNVPLNLKLNNLAKHSTNILQLLCIRMLQSILYYINARLLSVYNIHVKKILKLLRQNVKLLLSTECFTDKLATPPTSEEAIEKRWKRRGSWYSICCGKPFSPEPYLSKCAVEPPEIPLSVAKKHSLYLKSQAFCLLARFRQKEKLKMEKSKMK